MAVQFGTQFCNADSKEEVEEKIGNWFGEFEAPDEDGWFTQESLLQYIEKVAWLMHLH